MPTSEEQMDAAIAMAWREDIGSGDVTSAACIPKEAREKAGFLVKGSGVIAGLAVAKRVFAFGAPDVEFTAVASDGDAVNPGDVVAWAAGPARQILTAERLALNFMQRMSGIATGTRKVVALLQGTGTRVLDTRKTTPGIRVFEKAAVQIGGGVNHRMGLYDQILIKDNHVDYAGSMGAAVQGALDFLEAEGRKVPVVVEVRDAKELQEALSVGGVDRLLLDNFTPAQAALAVDLVGGRVQTEASGGLNPDNVRAYGEAGVDFVSLGWLTHSPMPLDISLKSASSLESMEPRSNG
ncbi:MAG: carboxylating nicotinate-nucleotide diphosphorylase [Flavobacteriales bacterium]|nr:carboxylating nicotinate-nucleotide diphosphorylase [Flavobacteriales bacterium]